MGADVEILDAVPVAGFAPAPADPLEDLLDAWTRGLDALPSTRREYGKAAGQFLAFLKEEGRLQPTEDDVVRWKRVLLEERRLTPGTVSVYLTAVRTMFAWLARRGLYPAIADRVPAPHRTAGFRRDDLSIPQLRDLLEAAGGGTERDRRDRAMLLLMACCGLRTIEVVRADREDLRTRGGQVVLYVQGKGRTDREEWVKVPPEVDGPLRAYLADRTVKTDGDGRVPLFSSTSRQNRGARLSTWAVSTMVKARMRAAGMDSARLTAHSLRHTCATVALRAGTPLPDVQAALRHRNAATTMQYTHALAREDNQTEATVAGVLAGVLDARGRPCGGGS